MPSTLAKGAAAHAQATSARAAASPASTSSPPPASTTTTTTTATAQPLLQPIQTRGNTPLSKTARHLFPAALAGLFLARFPALVADPVPAMAGSLLPLTAALQVGYAVVCLPLAGAGAGAGNGAARRLRPGEILKKRRAGGGGGGGGGVAAAAGEGAAGSDGGLLAGVDVRAGVASTDQTAILSLILSLLVTPFLHIAMVLFGAPFLTHGAHTLLCAAHLAVLALFPLFYVRGADGAAWAALGGFDAPFDEAFGGLVGGVIGAWLGAVPIPLDWDREWQKWPVTILCGMYGGHLLGRVLGGTLLWGKRF